MAKKPKLTSAADWRQRYGIASRTQTSMFDRFAGWYNLMYAHINTSSYALWRSKVFLPIVPQKAWDMIAKLLSLQPGFEVGLYGDALNDENAQERAEKMQWELEHNWDNPRFDEPMADKLFSPLVDAIVTGTGFAKVPWCYGNNTRYEKHIDEESGEVDITKDDKIESFEGYNDLEPLDVMSVFITPGAKNLYAAQWVILEDWPTVDDLRAENERAGEELYKNLDKVEKLKADSDQFYQYKRARSQITSNEDPLTADSTLRHFKRLECYEKSSGYIYTYAAGHGESDSSSNWIELNKRPLIFWHGKYPIVAFYTKRRPHSVWGQGIFEDTERMQAAFNDIFNHYMDNLNLSLDGMIMKEEGEEYNYTVQPGGEFLYKNSKPEQFKFPTPDAGSFQTVMTMIETQVENATLPPYAAGQTGSAKGGTQETATGILALQMATGDKIGFMRSNFANSVKQIGRFWLSNNQQFVSDDVTLQGTQDGKPTPVTISVADRQGQVALRINDASMDPPNQEQVLSQFEAYLTQLQALQKASVDQAMLSKWATPPLFINFASLVQDLSQKFRQANLDKIMLNSDEIMQKLGAMGPNAFITPNERIQIGINDLFGTESGQLLERNAIKPDPRRSGMGPAATTTTTPITGQSHTAPITPAGQAEEAAGLPVVTPGPNNTQPQLTQAPTGPPPPPEQPLPPPEPPMLPHAPANPIDQQVARDAHEMLAAGHLDHMMPRGGKKKKHGSETGKTPTSVR